MENNKTNPTPEAQTPIQHVPAVPGNSSKFITFLVISLILIIFIAGGVYLYINRQKAVTLQEVSQEPVVQANPKVEVTLDTLDRDLQAVQDQNTDSDFSSLDQDIQNL